MELLEKFLTGFVIAIIALIFLFIYFGIAGWIVVSLWNWLVPVLFHGPTINFWQALGLYILCNALFAGCSSSSSKS